jgi:hypothetical protein
MSEYKMHRARERRPTNKRKQAWEEEYTGSGRSTLQTRELKRNPTKRRHEPAMMSRASPRINTRMPVTSTTNE